MTDKQFLDITDIIAQSSHCGRRKVGAVIVKEGRIISTGYNGIPKPLKHGCFNLLKLNHRGFAQQGECPGCDDVIHSEQNAIFAAAKSGISLEGSTLYVNLSPCTTCAKAIVMSGIKRVVFKNSYKGDPAIYYLMGLGVKVERWEDNEYL